jgi:membrane-associated phospholipid phosphatase
VPLAVGIVALTAMWTLAGVAVIHSPIDAWDLRQSEWIAAHRQPALDTLTAAVLWGLGAVVLALVTRSWVAPALLCVALAGEKLTYLFSSLIVGRDRPPIPTLGHLYAMSSWPSGHVASAVTLYGSLALLALRAKPGWPATARAVVVALPLVIAVAVALARWYRGMHYVSDVVAGFALGLAWLALAAVIVRRAQRRIPA